MSDLDIGEVARRAGLAPSALRFYEQKGLIRPIGRQGLRRRYHPSVIERLGLIALGRAAGFPLDEVREMLAGEGGPRIDRGRLAARAQDLDRTIRQLVALRRGLRHAAACPAPDHLQCPTFRRLVRAAAAGALAAPPSWTPGARPAGKRVRATA